MRYALTLTLCLYAVPSFAGGIGFGPKYFGKHPFTGNTIVLSIPQERDAHVSLTVENTLGRADNLTLTLVTRNRFETIFELRESVANEDGDAENQKPKVGALVAKVVTTGDCQIVQTAALVFPSGVSTTIYNADNQRRIHKPRVRPNGNK